MRIYTLPGGWVIDLDSVTMVGTEKHEWEGNCVYSIYVNSGQTVSVNPKDLPRSRFLDVLANHS